MRTDLGVAAAPGRTTAPHRTLLAFAQLSDVHVVDHQSPARVEWTDRYDDPNATGQVPGIFASAYRPQEMLSAQVGDAMVRAINAVEDRPGHRAAAAVRDRDRGQLRQLPVQRGPLEHRRPRRRAGRARQRRRRLATRA